MNHLHTPPEIEANLPPRKRKRTQQTVVSPKKQSTTVKKTSSPYATVTPLPTSNKLNLLTATITNIHAHARSLAATDRTRKRIQYGFSPPVQLTSTINDSTTDDLEFDRATKFLYCAALTRALLALCSGCTGTKNNEKPTKQKDTTELIQNESIRIFAVMRGSGDLFDIIVRAARITKCNVEIHCVCMSKRARLHILKYNKRKIGSFNLITYHVHEIDTVLEDHGRAIQPSQLPEGLRAVYQTGRIVISDAIGAIGGNAMIGELMMASSSLFLSKEQEAEEGEEGEEGVLSSSSSTTTTTATTATTATSLSRNIMIPCQWTSTVAPVYMPGAYSMIHLMHQSLEEPFTCDVTDVARCLTPGQNAWSYSMQQGDDAPNGKISAHLTLEISPVDVEVDEEINFDSENKDQPKEQEDEQDDNGEDDEEDEFDGRRTPLPQQDQKVPTTEPLCVHGLVGTCSYELFDGITLIGGELPQEHNSLYQNHMFDTSTTTGTGSSGTLVTVPQRQRSNTSSLRTVFFPLSHPIMLNRSTVTTIDVSIFRTVCGAHDCYYFWDCDEDLDSTILPHGHQNHHVVNSTSENDDSVEEMTDSNDDSDEE